MYLRFSLVIPLIYFWPEKTWFFLWKMLFENTKQLFNLNSTLFRSNFLIWIMSGSSMNLFVEKSQRYNYFNWLDIFVIFNSHISEQSAVKYLVPFFNLFLKINQLYSKVIETATKFQILLSFFFYRTHFLYCFIKLKNNNCIICSSFKIFQYFYIT